VINDTASYADLDRILSQNGFFDTRDIKVLHPIIGHRPWWRVAVPGSKLPITTDSFYYVGGSEQFALAVVRTSMGDYPHMIRE
jgi:hypothetical protein